MAQKHHNPGCPCCDCYDETFTDSFTPFVVADGEYVTDRWKLSSGDKMETGSKPVGESWFHTIHIKKGDIDLVWDGITIEYRDNAGTITNGTNASNFVPGSELASGWQNDLAIHGTYLTLWVTPSWYAIVVGRRRYIFSNDANTRGSVQVINRDNSAAIDSIEITAVGGDVEIKSWRISDSTVSVTGGYEGGEITRECPKPDTHPNCTERFFQSQQALLTALTWDHYIDRYEIIRLVGAGPAGSDLFECQYLDSTTGGLSLRLGDSLVTAMPDITQCFILPVWRITGASAPNQTNPSSGASLGQSYTLADSEPAAPYPKPRARWLFAISGSVTGAPSACDDFANVEGEAFVVFQVDGKAPVQFDLDLPNLDSNYFDCFTAGQCAAGRDETSDPVKVLTRVTAEWDAE